MTENQNDVVYFARTNFRNQQRKFGVRLDDRRRHMYFIGKTGMGKTTVLENMMIQDVQKGHGLAVIDPHGDFVEKILDFIPSHRVNDVVYINPADVDFPVAFNVLESINPAHRHLVASGLLSVFKKMWIDSWGPRLEYILRNCILSLMEYPGSTLLGIPRILVDNDYRKKVVDKIDDPIVKAFWIEEFGQYAQQFRTEAISPIQNKIGQFLSSSLIRNIVGQPKSTIDLRAVMDEGKILLLNLSKGRIGEDNAGLLGGMMITKLQLAAMSRVDVLEEKRKDFFLYVDEFQNFATESFANILSEARKYRLNLIIAHQYIEQLDENVQAAVFGNVGSIICFRVGAADAEFLAKEFAPVFDETDLVNLTKYDVYLRLMIDGVASDPFSATTLPPVSGRTGNRDKVIGVSRERYANERLEVEEKIRRWSGVDEIFTGQGRGGDNGPRRNGPGRGSSQSVPFSPSKFAEMVARAAPPKPSAPVAQPTPKSSAPPAVQPAGEPVAVTQPQPVPEPKSKPVPEPGTPKPVSEPEPEPVIAPFEPDIPKEISLSEAIQRGSAQFSGQGGGGAPGPRPRQDDRQANQRPQNAQRRPGNFRSQRDQRPRPDQRQDKRWSAREPERARQPGSAQPEREPPKSEPQRSVEPPPPQTPPARPPELTPREHTLKPGEVVKFD